MTVKMLFFSFLFWFANLALLFVSLSTVKFFFLIIIILIGMAMASALVGGRQKRCELQDFRGSTWIQTPVWA